MSKKSVHKPNFFIVGAPKCGTTSLWKWLREHPQIFLPKKKEPDFFNFDHYRGECRTLEDYESFFKKAKPHQLIGEATPSYLWSNTAIPAILKYVKQPKIVVIIRHPVDMAISLHNNRVLQGKEDKVDFWTAWNLQIKRGFGADIPRKCYDPRDLWYADICRLGFQLWRLYEQVPKPQIHLMELEQVKVKPRTEYKRLLRFLDVEDDGRTSFPVANAASSRRFKTFWAGCNLIDNGFHAISGLYLPRPNFIKTLDQYTRKRVDSYSTINTSQRAELVNYFWEEIRLAEQVTGLNLDNWRR